MLIKILWLEMYVHNSQPYLRFNFRNLKCEINTSSGPRNRFPPSRNTPANPKSVSDIKLMLVVAEIVYTVQPAVIILPGLKKF